MKTIKIKISEDGSLSIETSGYSGGKCLDALKDIESLFGKAEEIEMKKEDSQNERNHTEKA